MNSRSAYSGTRNNTDEKKQVKSISELRQDMVTGDWVVVATGRAKRPNQFARAKAREKPQSKENCPFERLLETAVLIYDRQGRGFNLAAKDRVHSKKNWWLQIVPNKFPAFGRGTCSLEQKKGPYLLKDGVGFHEVVVTRHHTRAIADMSREEAAVVFRAYRDRYIKLKNEDCVEYVSVFHNSGHDAGATVSHPHSQIIAIPVIPPDVSRSLRGSAAYFRRKKRCVHCAMLDFEKRDKKRIIYANRDFIAYCPFVSRQAFEVRIFPIRHQPEFESITENEISSAADALRAALAKLKRGLGNPAYNFFVHTAPASDGARANYYHWHIEILPKTAIWAGFEISTGIEISTIAPETAAEFLRKIKA